jgi:hypothetical protein
MSVMTLSLTRRSVEVVAALAVAAVVAALLTVSTHPRADAAPCKWSSDRSMITMAQDDGYTVSVAASGQTLGPQATFAGGRKPDVNGTLWG